MHDYQNNNEGPNQRPSTLLGEEVFDQDGQEKVIWTEGYVRKPDGSIVKQRKLAQKMAADGRWIRADEFGGRSWSGLEVPKDRYTECADPFEWHGQRPVYLYQDGRVTKLGNVLCTECWEHQKKRLFWKYLLFFGLIYNPEEY